MPTRTTIMLDDPARTAARQLAVRYECSVSEAIRRALLRQRDAELGMPRVKRQQRVQTLERLFALFAGHDADDEIRRLKEQDEGF